MLRLLVLPVVVGASIVSPRKGDVQRLVDEIAATYSPAHAQKALTALRVVVRVAERDAPMVGNPCPGVRSRSDRDGGPRTATTHSRPSRV